MMKSTRISEQRFDEKSGSIDNSAISKLYPAQIKLRRYFGRPFAQSRTQRRIEASRSKLKHRINDHIITVKVASKRSNSCYKQTVEKLASDNGGRLILHVLSDECLMKVFGRLHLRDLCNVAEVCKRFERNAQEMFKLTYSKLDIRELLEGDRNDSDHLKTRELSENFKRPAKQLFHNFGSMIQALTLTGTDDESGMDEHDLLILAKMHCTSLKDLTLIGMYEDESFSNDLRLMFAGLETLNLEWCAPRRTKSHNLKRLLSGCLELRSLRVEHCSAMVWLEHTFPKLELLDISDYFEYCHKMFDQFLERHGNLRTLIYGKYCWSSEILATIGNCLPKLETLRYSYQEIDDDLLMGEDERTQNKNILHLSKLKSLKTLSTQLNGADSMKLLIDALFEENIPIERLEMLNSMINKDLVISLSKITSMEALSLVNCELDKVSLIELAIQLPMLSELELDTSGLTMSQITEMLPFAKHLSVLKIGSVKSTVQINIVDYQSILKVVKGRDNGIQLCIILISDIRTLQIPQIMQLDNLRWLKIDEKIGNSLTVYVSDSDSQSYSDTDSASDAESEETMFGDSSMSGSEDYSDFEM